VDPRASVNVSENFPCQESNQDSSVDRTNIYKLCKRWVILSKILSIRHHSAMSFICGTCGKKVGMCLPECDISFLWSKYDQMNYSC